MSTYYYLESLQSMVEEKKNDLRQSVKFVREIIEKLTGLINVEKSRLSLIKNISGLQS